MAKIIKITPECIDEIRKEFEATLSGAKMSDGKISFTRSFGAIKREATVYYSELAWLKMQTLIREFDKEVAWHGLAYRGEDPTKDEYIIRDILVYPQEVAAATVNTDQEKYQSWLMSHDDEVFNNIRMQGHSHVNMGVTPSGVDTSLYDRILEQLDDTMFYIFLIYNKRGDKTYKIYDLAKNVLFETADVTVKILDDGTGIEKFLREAKEMVKDKAYTSHGATTYGGYGTFGGGYMGTVSQIGTYTKPEDTKKDEGKKAEDKNGGNQSTAVQVASNTLSKSGRRKGRRKDRKSGNYRQLSFADDGDDDTEEGFDDNPFNRYYGFSK